MKKQLLIMVTALTVILAGTTCFAQTVDNKELGVKFELSDNWKQIPVSIENAILFEHSPSSDKFMVEMSEVERPYPISYMGKEYVEKVFKETFGKEYITRTVSEANGGIFVNVDITYENSAVSTTTTGKHIYTYYQEYTVSADGYNDMSETRMYGYMVENGKEYYLTYLGGALEEGVNDVFAALDTIEFANDYIEIYIDKERVFPDSAPIIRNNRTLVPIRAIVEHMGYDVEWDQEARKVTITDGTTKLEFVIDNDKAYKNSTEEIALDAPATIYKDRTYIPLRTVGEALDTDVVWDGEERAVNIWWKSSPDGEII